MGGALMLVAVCVALAGCGKSGSSGSSSAGGTFAGASGAASTADTVNAVQSKVKADNSLAGANIEAKLENGSIRLDGTVKSPTQKDRAEQVVLQTQQEKNQQTGVLDYLTVEEGAGGTTPSGGPSGSH